MAADITISTPTVLDAGIDTSIVVAYLTAGASMPAALDASVDTIAVSYDLNVAPGLSNILNSMPGATGGGGGGGGGGSVRPTTGMLYPRGQG